MKNKKGFVLVESIIAAVFVLALSTFLILNIVPLVAEYEKTLNYDGVDSKYDAHMIRKMILMDDDCSVASILTLNTTIFGSKPQYYYFEGDEICDFLSHKNYCRKLLSSEFLDVKEIIISDYNGTNFKKLTDNDKEKFSRILEEYLDQMPVYDRNTSLYYQYANRMVVVFNDGSVTNIEILKTFSGSIC